MLKLDTIFEKEASALKSILAGKLYQIIGGKASKDPLIGDTLVESSGSFPEYSRPNDNVSF